MYYVEIANHIELKKETNLLSKIVKLFIHVHNCSSAVHTYDGKVLKMFLKNLPTCLSVFLH